MLFNGIPKKKKLIFKTETIKSNKKFPKLGLTLKLKPLKKRETNISKHLP